MNSITQEARFRQGVIKYARRHGVTEASIRYKVSRMFIYRWQKRYDGSWKSLRERSHRPHHCPNEQTAEEYELIRRHFPYYDDMIMLMYDEHSTYCSLDFLKKLINAFPFPIREIQTDNGTERANALLVKKATHKTLFEEYLEENGIIYHRIRVATPRHNGKVERQHWLDAFPMF